MQLQLWPTGCVSFTVNHCNKCQHVNRSRHCYREHLQGPWSGGGYQQLPAEICHWEKPEGTDLPADFLSRGAVSQKQVNLRSPVHPSVMRYLFISSPSFVKLVLPGSQNKGLLSGNQSHLLRHIISKRTKSGQITNLWDARPLGLFSNFRRGNKWSAFTGRLHGWPKRSWHEPSGPLGTSRSQTCHPSCSMIPTSR